MKNVLILLSILAMTSLDVVAGELYRWKDDKGRVHYSDTPPQNVEQATRKKLMSDSSPNEDIPYETRRAQESFPVTLYVSDTCTDPCVQARNYLRNRGIPYTEVMLRTKTEIEEFQRKSGSVNAPTLAIGKSYLGGFQESRWGGELDVAGYPKTATYRQSIAPAPVPISPKASASGAVAPATGTEAAKETETPEGRVQAPNLSTEQ